MEPTSWLKEERERDEVVDTFKDVLNLEAEVGATLKCRALPVPARVCTYVVTKKGTGICERVLVE